MKNITDIAAQGELLILIGPANEGVEEIPPTAKPVEPTNGRHVFGHSETGHHHTVEASRWQFFADAIDPNLFYFKPIDLKPTRLEHERPDHKHETLSIDAKGAVVTVRRQISGWTRQAMVD
jgi:hypothetical protein